MLSDFYLSTKFTDNLISRTYKLKVKEDKNKWNKTI